MEAADGQPTQGNNFERFRIVGIEIPHLPPRTKFISIAAGAICSAMAFAALQESVTREKDFHFHGFMTVVTCATMSPLGFLELLKTKEKRIGKMQDYFKLSVLTVAGMWFTNWSLEYLNYPTRVLFKSSKLIPTMIVGTLMQGRFYSALECGP